MKVKQGHLNHISITSSSCHNKKLEHQGLELNFLLTILRPIIDIKTTCGDNRVYCREKSQKDKAKRTED